MIIDRLVVTKGPNSTLYGSEALAGVINIIMKDPKGSTCIKRGFDGNKPFRIIWGHCKGIQ
jgi:outer membrane receptor for ferrienterochelin and colicin